jgi:RNA polymerase sigma-70 factor (ECF subfamily)
MKDEDLARGLMGPDRASTLAEIARRFGDPILVIALKWYRLSRPDAEEVLNDTLWDATRAAGQFDAAKGSFRSWLIGIACNRARRRRRPRELPMPAAHESRTPEQELLFEEARERVESAMKDMTPLQRDIVSAMLEQGPEELTDRMLADLHRTTPGTVKVERWRVRRRLSKFFRVDHA